jgi:hypothetical protein
MKNEGNKYTNNNYIKIERFQKGVNTQKTRENNKESKNDSFSDKAFNLEEEVHFLNEIRLRERSAEDEFSTEQYFIFLKLYEFLTMLFTLIGKFYLTQLSEADCSTIISRLMKKLTTVTQMPLRTANYSPYSLSAFLMSCSVNIK